MNTCFKRADILLPDFGRIDPMRWSVIACDQFTSEPHYWQRAANAVGTAPSTLNLILPEVYLSEAEERIPKINEAMKHYCRDILVEHRDSAIYVKRTQSDGAIRRGIVLSVDLEDYDYTRGAQSLIRATEATVVERIPPRVAVRRGAMIELPHVMLLIDDPECTVIEPLEKEGLGETAYDTPLMLGGGHIEGRFISPDSYERISRALCALISPEQMARRYGAEGLAPLLFAVGDGNHSLATAKATYEELKASLGEKALEHPARYALVEIVNIHDKALKFEPIYRVMFGVEPREVIASLQKYISALSGDAPEQLFTILYGNSQQQMRVPCPVKQLTVGTLQDFIDEYIGAHEGAQVDYIHGTESLEMLSGKPHAIGFCFSGMSKAELFKTVIFDGALPRKTFSMGHAEDKRYYMEAKKIK